MGRISIEIKTTRLDTIELIVNNDEEQVPVDCGNLSALRVTRTNHSQSKSLIDQYVLYTA